MVEMQTGLPEAISLDQFGELYQISPGLLPKIPERLPKNCTFKVGRRWMVWKEPTRKYFEAGGGL
ncbi:hypothetical protein ABS71_10465 [bacterium SCN 62-11]|nr:MAG: hypothetical protein ABS71_10465 [bacterium SCN 62-11]